MVKTGSWRYDQGHDDYASCEALHLGSGILLRAHKDNPISLYNDIQFTSYCDDQRPLYSALIRTAQTFPYLEQIQQDWKAFISSPDSSRGPFKYSIYAILLSFTANFVIALSLTVIVFITVRQKPYRGASNLLKLGSSLASINLTIFVAKAMSALKEDHINKGIVSTNVVLNLLWNDLTFACLDLLVVLICELCQVQIVMRLFSRVREKRFVFLAGVVLSLISQVLWAIPSFTQIGKNHSMGLSYDTDGLILLSPFVYLMRITFSAFYASIICFNVFIKRNLCLQNQRMILLTFITILMIFMQPAFFVADVTNVWVDDLSEIFNTTCYVGSAVIVWEWVDYLLILERKVQAQSVLGRPVYEDDQQDYYFAKYALKTQDNQFRGSNINTTNSSSNSATYADIPAQVPPSMDNNKVEFNERPPIKERLLEGCTKIIDGMIYYTDHFIVKGLVIKTLSLHSKNSSDDYSKRKAKVRRRIGLDRPNEVYVYATRDVVFDSEEEEHPRDEEEEAGNSVEDARAGH
ncbi:LAME_0F19416g1_1 [Lachancea meyersii CBS 8951]|uniref:pH-response regulator protein palH/RIM21 n=1 Tax=Lachancea meyersii CBS 8951 TaxID=1266667 RepID=A0A1G4K1L3_9SACH|nr:LAME_0F19416g1_1 [Lachancea meyersii CBS 8951]